MGFYAEESGQREVEHEFFCSIDPIDGTKYFVKGIPLFAIAVSISTKNNPVLGIIYAPMMEMFYLGSEVTPTMFNGKTISINSKQNLEKAYVSVDFSPRYFDNDFEKEWANDKFLKIINNSQRARIFGLAALSLAWVSGGNLDAYVDITGHKNKLYDIEAGKALVKYSGGEIRDVKIPNIESSRLIAGNPYLVDQLESILLSH